MPYIFRPSHQANKTLVNIQNKVKEGNVQPCVGTSNLPKNEYKNVMEKCNLSGAIHEKIGKLKVDDKAAKKKKLKDTKPITFDINKIKN